MLQIANLIALQLSTVLNFKVRKALLIVIIMQKALKMKGKGF